MKTDGKFYTMTTDSGIKTVNIENIASIENINNQTVVTLNVKDKNDQNISFVADLPWAIVSSEVTFMSEQVWKR